MVVYIIRAVQVNLVSFFSHKEQKQTCCCCCSLFFFFFFFISAAATTQHVKQFYIMGSSGEKSAKKAKKEKKDTPKSSKKRDRDGLPVPSSASKGGEGGDDEKQNPVCAIASPLADGKLTKKLLKVVKKGKQMNKSGGRGDIRGRRRERTSPSFCFSSSYPSSSSSCSLLVVRWW